MCHNEKSKLGNAATSWYFLVGNDCNLLFYVRIKHVFENFLGAQLPGCPPYCVSEIGCAREAVEKDGAKRIVRFRSFVTKRPSIFGVGNRLWKHKTMGYAKKLGYIPPLSPLATPIFASYILTRAVLGRFDQFLLIGPRATPTTNVNLHFLWKLLLHAV